MDGCIQLFQAIRFDDVCGVTNLISDTALLHAKHPETHDSVIHNAARFGSIKVAKVLLKCDIDINDRDKHGMTPLMTSIRNDQHELTAILCARGADVNVHSFKGLTALDCVLSCPSNNDQAAKCVKVLCKHGLIAKDYSESKLRDALDLIENNQSIEAVLKGCGFLRVGRPVKDALFSKCVRVIRTRLNVSRKPNLWLSVKDLGLPSSITKEIMLGIDFKE